MESLSIQFQPFFEWLLRTTLQASLLICLILLLQTMLRSRLGVRWHYCLWLLLLVRMAIPWMPESRVSMFNLLPQSMPQRQLEHAKGQIADDSADSIAASANTSESAPISTATVAQAEPESKEADGQAKLMLFEFVAVLPLAWLVGALALAIYVCASNLNFLRIVRLRRPLTDQKVLDLLEDCKSQMGIRTILGIVTTDKVKSPALFGFVRPRLLLPEGMIETLDQQELRYVLLHELAHLKRHDIYIGWLISLLQVLHWFNPLVWLAFYRMRSDRELACDALVMARTQSDEPKNYGRIIVNLVERFSRPQRLPGMAGILETKAHLKRRITMITTRIPEKVYHIMPSTSESSPMTTELTMLHTTLMSVNLALEEVDSKLHESLEYVSKLSLNFQSQTELKLFDQYYHNVTGIRRSVSEGLMRLKNIEKNMMISSNALKTTPSMIGHHTQLTLSGQEPSE